MAAPSVGGHSLPTGLRPNRDARPWQNWIGSQRTVPAYLAQPRDARELSGIVLWALEQGLPVRAVGQGYSWAEVNADAGVLVRSEAFSGVGAVDPDRGAAWIGAGTPLHQLNAELFARGLQLPNLGGFSRQSLGGAVATATHGSGRDVGSLSDAVLAMRLVDGEGLLREIDGSEPELLRAARVSLGLLGIVTEVKMRVEPARWLASSERWQATAGRVLWERSGARSDIRWHPGAAGQAFCVRQRRDVDAEDAGALPSHLALAPLAPTAPAPLYVMEYAVPLGEQDAVLDAVAGALAPLSEPLTAPLSLRVVRGDDAVLSPFFGGDRLTVSVAATDRANADTVFPIVHEALLRYEPRPHWAKEHRFTPRELRAMYPDLSLFEDARRRLDPHGAFLTGAMRNMFDVVSGVSE